MRMVFIALGILLFLLIGIGAGAANPDKVKEVREKYEEKILEIEGVTGVYEDEETGQLVVMVEEERHIKNIPKKLEDVDLRVDVTGKIRALDTEAMSIMVLPPLQINPRLIPQRPLFGGISVGSAGIPASAGTLGLIVQGNDGQPYVLSNAHVLAMDSYSNFLNPGTPVWQPGGFDGGTMGDRIGVLSNYIPIIFWNYRAKNYADAAIASLDPGIEGNYGEVLGNDLSMSMYEIRGTANVARRDMVRKSGRTTGVSWGSIQNTRGTVMVSYPYGKWAIFKDQIITSAMSQGGDSGSAVDKEGRFVGLLFAGSDTVTIVSKEKHILGPLGITV